MGRTGVLTPTAVFEPIEIDGSTIERASLHNISIMNEILGEFPYRNQQIKVYKANMIIPQIKEGIWEEEVEKEYLEIPATCPICGHETQFVTINESTDLICMNPSCEGKLVNRLDHFAGKKGLEIKGLSKATLERLISWGWVTCATDIFKLKQYKEEWMLKDGFGEKSVSNILSAIKQSEICSLDKFIAALGIPLIGSVASKQLAKKFNTWENFYLAIQSEYKFYELPNFGSEMHDALIKFNYT
jgi:DNA ligase (NAD+)